MLLEEQKEVLIETYWNVNIIDLTKAISVLTVLIETYWNVNGDYLPRLRPALSVLIETYWNVNLWTPTAKEVSEIGLNRNILECK